MSSSALSPSKGPVQKGAAIVLGIGVGILILAGIHLTSLSRVATGGWSSQVAFLLHFALLFAFAMVLLIRWGKVRNQMQIAVCVFLLALTLFLRICCLDHETGDYQHFLVNWVQFFRDNGGVLGLGSPLGDYNIPYMYILSLISYSGLSDLLLIKIVSIFFDFLTAWGVFLLTRHLMEKREKPPSSPNRSSSISAHGPLIAFFITLYLPTVFLNGALWAQCDSIYGAFAVLSVYCALSDRPIWSVFLIALSFSFKLQAIFIMPLFLLFVFAKKVKFRQLFLFPVFYVAICLPALLLGRPVSELVTIYLNQTGTYSDRLTLNAPSIYTFLPSEVQDPDVWKVLGIMLAAGLVLAVFLVAFLRQKGLTDQALLTAGLIFSLGIPLFLPHMHERYYFLIEVLAVVYAVTRPRRFFLPIAVQVASLGGYHAYLTLRYAYPLSYGAALLCLSLPVLLCDFWADTSVRAPLPKQAPPPAAPLQQ